MKGIRTLGLAPTEPSTTGGAPPLPPPERRVHPFYMYEMIHSIPTSFNAVIEQMRSVNTITYSNNMYFTGSGTSFYAAWMGSQIMYGHPKYFLLESNELVWHHDVAKDSLVVAVSHSGVTKSTVDAVAKAKRKGALTVAVTHHAGQPISLYSDITLVVGDGPDLSRCHTKTYIDSAAAVFLLSLSLMGAGGAAADLNKEWTEELPKTMFQVLRQSEEDAAAAAKEMVNVKKIFVVGSGYNLVTAREAALKIKESSYIMAEGIALEEFLHGPWVTLDENSLVVCVAPTPSASNRCQQLIVAARKVGARTMTISHERLGAEHSFLVPRMPEVLSPFVTILPAYLFAYYLSVNKGNNPDYLRYLDPKYWEARNIIFPPGTH